MNPRPNLSKTGLGDAARQMIDLTRCAKQPTIIKCKHVDVYEPSVRVGGDGGGSDGYCLLKWCRDCGALKLKGGKWQYPRTHPSRSRP